MTILPAHVESYTGVIPLVVLVAIHGNVFFLLVFEVPECQNQVEDQMQMQMMVLCGVFSIYPSNCDFLGSCGVFQIDEVSQIAGEIDSLFEVFH